MQVRSPAGNLGSIALGIKWQLNSVQDVDMKVTHKPAECFLQAGAVCFEHLRLGPLVPNIVSSPWG